MTDISDISNWSSQLNPDGTYMDMPDAAHQVPFNEYQIGILLGALARSERNGEWEEIVSILLAAMEEAGIKEVRNNFGDHFLIEDIRCMKLHVR